MSPSRLRVKKAGAWKWISLKGLAKRIRLGDADGCARLVEGYVDDVLVQLEAPQREEPDAALESKALEDEPDAAFAETMESDGESSETLEMAEMPNEAFD